MERTRLQHRTRPRRRLTVQERRDELLRLGLEVFGRQGYDEVSVEDVAAQAGISTGLLYHYFPNKKEYFLAVVREAVSQIYVATTPATPAPVNATLSAAVAHYLHHAAAHPMGFLATHRSALSADADVKGIVAEARDRQLERILNLLEIPDERATFARLTVLGWMSMVYEVTATWLTSNAPDADSVAQMLVGALLGAVGQTTAVR